MKLNHINCKVSTNNHLLTEMVAEVVRGEHARSEVALRAGHLAYIIWRHTQEEGSTYSELYPFYWGDLLRRTTGLALSRRQVQRAIHLLEERQFVQAVVKRAWRGGWQKPEYRATSKLMDLGSAILRTPKKAA